MDEDQIEQDQERKKFQKVEINDEIDQEYDNEDIDNYSDVESDVE